MLDNLKKEFSDLFPKGEFEDSAEFLFGKPLADLSESQIDCFRACLVRRIVQRKRDNSRGK